MRQAVPVNLCFDALDRHVVGGLGDEPALRVDRMAAGRIEHTFAKLLEEVAAFAGVLRAFGVGPGERVLSRLPTGLHGLVAALGTARLGAVHVGSASDADPTPALEEHRPVVVLAEGRDASALAALDGSGQRLRAAIWRGSLPAGQDLEWDVLLRAGRTDPASAVEVVETAEAFVMGDRVVTTRQALEDDSDWPLDAISTLLAGGTVVLSPP